MANKLLKWLIFGVLVALLPILFNLLFAISVGAEVTVGRIIGRGELLLIAVGLCSTALGDLVLAELPVRSRFWRGARLVLTGMCVVVIAASSFYFALVSDRYARQIDVSEEVVVLISSTLYAAAVISSVMSVLLSER